MRPSALLRNAADDGKCEPDRFDRVDVIEDASTQGARLVAQIPFRRGELILPLNGKPTAPSYRTIQIDLNTHVEDPMIAFMNHSCRPTAIVDAQALTIHAATDLTPGEEVTFFYPSTEWAMVRPFQCLCHAAGCIGLVAGAQCLPLHILSGYFVNPHIRCLAATALLEVASDWQKRSIAHPQTKLLRKARARHSADGSPSRRPFTQTHRSDL
jgi:SET domain